MLIVYVCLLAYGKPQADGENRVFINRDNIVFFYGCMIGMLKKLYIFVARYLELIDVYMMQKGEQALGY